MGKKKIANKKVKEHPTLGLIPNGWEVHRFADVFEFLPTNSFSRDQMTYGGDKNSIYNIHYGDIHATFNEQILDFNKHIHQIPVLLDTTEVRSNDNAFLKDGDLIIADASEDYEGVGECIEIIGINKRKVLSGLHTLAARDLKGKTIQGFRSYLLKNQRVFINLKKLATGSKVYGVSKGNVAELELVIPTIPEQQKIAHILSTWDKAIEKTEQLITQKQQLKKGLMQQLLTGKVRFKEFKKAKWKKIKLEALGEFSKGSGITKADLLSTGIPCIRYGEIYTVHNILIKRFFSFINKTTADLSKPLLSGDILFAGSGETAEEIGKCVAYIGDKRIYAGGDIIILRPNSNVNPLFLSYILNSSTANKQKSSMGKGHSVVHIYPNDLKKIIIEIPMKEEQTIIGETLLKLENEIELYGRRLDNLFCQKKGLMQKLLIGEVRSVIKNIS